MTYNQFQQTVLYTQMKTVYLTRYDEPFTIKLLRDMYLAFNAEGIIDELCELN